MQINQKKEFIGQTGQNIVEYMILIATVIAVLLIFLGRGGIFQKSYNKVISIQGGDIKTMSNKIFN